MSSKFVDIINDNNNYLGYSMTAGDFNADGKTDLAVGAYGYSTNTGRTYIYINESKVLEKTITKVRGTAKFRGTVKFR